MAHIFADRVRETTTTSGTGPFAPRGPAQACQRFADVMVTGDTCFASVVHRSRNEWLVAKFSLLAAGTLSVVEVFSSSNGGAAVNFSPGTKDIYITDPAARIGTPITEGFGIDVNPTGGTNGTPLISIDPNYPGQPSITTVGTVTTGTWAGAITGAVFDGGNF